MFDLFKDKIQNESDEPARKVRTEDDIQNLFDSLKVRELSIVIGSDIEKYINTLIDKIWQLRKETVEENGFIIPLVNIKENDELQENEYIIKVRDNVVLNGFVIPREDKSTDEIRDNVKKICEEYLEEIFSLKLTEKYVQTIQSTNEYLYYTLYNFYTVSSIKYVLVHLLKNNQSIKDIAYIIEKLNEFAMVERVDKCFYCNHIKAAEYVLDEMKRKAKCIN